MTPAANVKRTMTIVDAPGADQPLGKPMLKIANRFLYNSGFTVGTKVEVEYAHEVVIIRKLSTV